MNRFTLKHLRWVLWLWLLLVEVSGEDGVTSKSEKHLVIKQESGPKGDSLVRSFVSTRTSRAFSSTSSFDDGWRTDKPPDERQSTIRLRNDTVDLSKNTVPVLKYPGPTESSLKEKYRRTTGSPETTPLKKNLKLKRNMTRSRPSDLTTLLVYNALTPGRYPSTTQVAESMPPTAWALASLKGPAPPPNVKPFVSWSTRLSRATTPSPITEVTELVTEMGTTNQQDIISGFDTTAPGNEEIDTTALSNEGTSPIPIVEAATLPITTQKSAEVTALKPEENTISVPPLSSLKNRTFEQETGDIIPDYESHKKVLIEPTLRKNDSFLLPDEEHQHSSTTNESRNNMTPFILTTKPTAKLNKTFRPEDNLKVTEENNDASLKINYDSLNKTDQEVDPSINAINVKKRDDQISTSTVISAVNSTVTIHVTSPISTTSRNSNLTNLIDVDHKLSANEFEYGKNLPLSVETTTVPLTSYPPPSPQIADHDPLFNEANQTSNDIQVIAKSSKITPMASDNVSMETPSTLKSNEIKPELVSTNSVKNANITEYPTDSFHNYVQEFSETTQSNDILVQDQIKPVNKTLIQHISESSLDNQKHLTSTVSVLSIKPTSYPVTLLVANKTITPYVAMTEVTPVNDTAISNVTIPMNETFTNDMTTLPPITTTPLPITTIIPNTEPITVSSFSSTPLSISDSSSTTLPITFPTTIRTTSSSPMNITSTNTNITQNNMTNNTNMITTSTTTTTTTTTTTAPVLITTQSNKLRDEDFVTELLSETNTTNFESDSKSSIKNDTSFGFRDSEDGEDDDTLSYNHTDISDRKLPSDTISNNDNEDDSDDLLETTVSGNISTTAVNSSKETTTPVPVTNLSSPKPTFSEEATRIDEERTNIDDDTIYDTAGIMPIYIRLVIQATYHELCKNKDPLKDSIVKVFKNYAERTINRRQVMITNLGINDCSTFREEMEPRLIPVHIMLTNTQGQYDKSLNDLFISLARRKNLDFKYPISQVEKVQQDLFPETETQISGTMVAAIVISSIAAVCLFALTILLVIMRKRQTGFNYGQRCTPVSLDDYSLDNISVYNSVRRKAIRASKRSYGNPAFDDADAISNPVNFAGLANMSSDKSKTDEEYSSLPQVVVKPDELPPGAEIKNRYANVIPIPETRVQLRASTPENQFINANFVKGAKGADKFYIACQAPIQNTIEDFWQMIWDEQSRLIIMLTALTENGVEKCADYLPPSEVLDCHRVFGDLQVTLKKREAREKYVISSLQLKNLETNLWREVTHMWYAGWPPMGVPPEPSSVIAFLIEARSYSKSSPIVVHCSPGTGRTGTVIAIDIAIRDFEAGRSVDIPKTVVQVRRGRAGAVQTKDQYSFIYKVLHLYATKLTGGGLDSI